MYKENNIVNNIAIIAVGYRVNSKKATRFRQWATKTLKEYITKGFVLNDDMLKNGKPFEKDYFDELLDCIREIRASELVHELWHGSVFAQIFLSLIFLLEYL